MDSSSRIVESSAWKTWDNRQHPIEGLRFQVRFPTELGEIQELDFEPNETMPVVDLAHARNAGESWNLEFIVQASLLQDEVALSHYLTRWMDLGKESMLSDECIEGDQDRPNFLSERTFEDGEVWVTRRTAFKIWNGAGAYVLILNIACPKGMYEQRAAQMLEIANSFSPFVPPEYNLAERCVLISRRFPVDFATYLPMSWRDQGSVDQGVESMKTCYARHMGKTPIGLLTISSGKFTTHRDFKKTAREALAPLVSMGLDLEELQLKPERPMVNMLPTFSVQQELVGDSTENSMACSLDYWIVCGHTAWISLEMLGVTRRQDFEGWAINQRCMHLLRREFRSKLM